MCEGITINANTIHRTAASAYFLAELPLRSPRKLFIFIILIYIYRIKVSKKINKLILKKETLTAAAQIGPG